MLNENGVNIMLEAWATRVSRETPYAKMLQPREVAWFLFQPEVSGTETPSG